MALQATQERQSQAAQIVRLEQELRAAERRAEETADNELADAAAAELESWGASLKVTTDQPRLPATQAVAPPGRTASAAPSSKGNGRSQGAGAAGPLPPPPQTHRGLSAATQQCISRIAPFFDTGDAFRASDLDHQSDQLLRALAPSLSRSNPPWPLPSPLTTWPHTAGNMGGHLPTGHAEFFGSGSSGPPSDSLRPLIQATPAHPFPTMDVETERAMVARDAASAATTTRQGSGSMGNEASDTAQTLNAAQSPLHQASSASLVPSAPIVAASRDSAWGPPTTVLFPLEPADNSCGDGLNKEVAMKLYHRFGLNSCISFEKFVQLHESHLPRENPFKEPSVRPAAGGA